jgi:hypothetical protein
LAQNRFLKAHINRLPRPSVLVAGLVLGKSLVVVVAAQQPSLVLDLHLALSALH